MVDAAVRPVVLVGLRSGVSPERDRNWRFNRARWETLGWPIYEGHHDADEGPFNMAAASNRAAALATDAGWWNVALYVGADFAIGHPDQVRRAVLRAVSTRRLTFAHDKLALLTAKETDRYEQTGILDTAEAWHPNTFSGVLAVPRSLWDEVGGFDERFVGWGWEDLAFWSACTAIAGDYERIPGGMVHLWHPRTTEMAHGHDGYADNEALGRRYMQARGSAQQTAQILAERSAT